MSGRVMEWLEFKMETPKTGYKVEIEPELLFTEE
jgi:hypothetical protein